MNTPRIMEFKNADLLAKFVRYRLNWSPFRYGMAILIVNLVMDFSSAFYFGAFVAQSGPPGLFQDPTQLLVGYVMMPVIGGFYIWSIIRIGTLLQQLYSSNVITDEANFDRLVQELAVRLRNKLPLVVSIITSVIVTLLLLGTFLNWYGWSQSISFLNHSDVLPWLRSPMWFITMYGVCFGLFNIASTVIALRRIFRDQSINLSPWHPDRCGGLRGISQYSLTLGYAIAVIGLTISVLTIQEIYFGTFKSSYLVWIGLVGYIFLSPLIFFLPLGTAHAAMRKAKTTHLLALSKQFDAHYKRIVDALSNGDGEIKMSVEIIGQLHTLYKITEEFTIWPFDIANLRIFLTITLAPLLPGVFSAIFEFTRIFLMD